SDDHRHPSIESFRDLRIALNALDLRRSRRRLSGDVPDAIDRVLAGVTDHYTRCAAANARQPAPPALLATIDDALRRVAGRNLPGDAPADSGTAPAAPATPAMHRRLRDTLHALVGLRLSLYPAAAGQPPQAADGARA
ncbi:FUSC family protein, partial [Pseudomonas sp. MWU13-2625]